MARTLGEQSPGKIKAIIERMREDDRLELLSDLMRSMSTMEKLREIIVENEDEDMQNMKDYLQYNTLGFNPNPWDNLPKPDSKCHAVVQPASRKNLASLPNEVLQKIGALLSRASAGALALVNREFKERLGPVFIGPVYLGDQFDFDEQKRFEFLQLLERDSENQVACPSCCKLHRWNRKQCGENKKYTATHVHTPRFRIRIPTFLTYNIIRALALSYVKRGQDSPECRRLLTTTTQRRSLWEESARATRSVLNQFVDGNLISRSQISIAPYVNRTFTGSSFLTLIETLTNPAFQICDHFDFPSFLQYLDTLDPHTGYGHDDGRPMGNGLSNPTTWGLNGNHPASQYTFYDTENDPQGIKLLGELPVKVQEHQTILSPALYNMFFWGFKGQVRSCNRCATDFGLAVKFVEGAGPVLVMTVWKNLGGPCREGEDELRSPRKWQWDGLPSP